MALAMMLAGSGTHPTTQDIVSLSLAVFCLVFLFWVAYSEMKIKARAYCQRIHNRIARAEQIHIETRGHATDWYEAAAQVRREEILAKAAEIQREKADRTLRNKLVESDYQTVGNLGAKWYGLDPNEVVAKLRKAADVEFRVLEIAMRITEEK